MAKKCGKRTIDTKKIFEKMLQEAKNEVSRHKSTAEMYTDELREAREHLEYLQEGYDKCMAAAAEWQDRVAILLMVLDKYKEKEEATTGKTIVHSFFVPTNAATYDSIVEQLAKLGHVDDYRVEFGGDEQYEFIFRSDVDVEELIGLLDI